MSKSKKWKPGEIGYIYTNELYDISFDRSVKVEVLADLESGLHPVKVKSLKSGIVYYCRHEEIHSRAAKVKKKPAQDIVPELIKEQSEVLAERRMKELKKMAEIKKPTREEIQKKFEAITLVKYAEINCQDACPECMTDYTSECRDLVIDLAYSTLFRELQNGIDEK
ncbi:hypothetical protein [Ileibacterium valens]|uniref:hypothetical protein n=1 Tax=Ileibacterium valens TaxID=1862668 RepID=UPI0024BA2398|nr:hypothetical protein [Ileibacterium valens]